MVSTRLVTTALAVGLVTPANPAAATLNNGVVIGTGTISPGIPSDICRYQSSVTFDGNAVLTGTHAGVYSVHFDGSGSGNTCIQQGRGCGTLSGQFTGSLCYVRQYSLVTLSGSLQMYGGPAHSIVTSACHFTPTSVNPIQSYALICDLTIL